MNTNTAAAPADFLAHLLAGVGVAPTAADLHADAIDRADARVDYCADVLAAARRRYGYNSARADAAILTLSAARRARGAIG
jgi:hypothetical protein